MSNKTITVTFNQPLDEPMPVEEAKWRAGWVGELVDEGRMSFVAFAEGDRRAANGEEDEVMFFLIYDHEDKKYRVFENWTDTFEAAVLIDGVVQNDHRPLPPDEALARWIAGFVVKNDASPESCRLSYRLIRG